MRRIYNEDFEYYTDPKTGDINCKILAKAAQQDGVRVANSAEAKNKDDKDIAYDKKHVGFKDDYTSVEPRADRPSKNPEVAKAVYRAMKKHGKEKEIVKKYNTDPSADVTFNGNPKNPDSVTIHPDGSDESYNISMDTINKYIPKEGEKKKMFPIFKKQSKDPSTFKVAENRRRMRESETGKHTLTYMFEARIRYSQNDISDKAFDYQFDDYILYNGNYSFNPYKRVMEAVEADFEEMGPTGLAQYISDYDGELKDCVESIIGSFDPDKEILYMECVLKEGVEPNQIIEYVSGVEHPLDEALKDYIEGQLSDGWGEGFEQHVVDEAECYCAYNIDDEEDCNFYANERSAVDEANANTYEEEVDEDGDVVEEAVSWDWCRVNVEVYCSFYDFKRNCYKGCLIDGRDEKGFDKEGFDKDGYNKYGRDAKGFDKEGYNTAGYDKDGFDKSGFNREGKDRAGFDKSGVKPMNNKRPTDKSGREQGAKFNVTKDGKVRIANTFDMGEAVKLSRKRVAEAKKILAKNNRLREAEAAVEDFTEPTGTQQLFAHIRSNDDWIQLQCGLFGCSESDALITFDPSMIGSYFALDVGDNVPNLDVVSLEDLQELPYPPNVITIVGDSPYIEDLDEWLEETSVEGDEADFEEMDMGEKAAEIAFYLSDIFESKAKKANLKEKVGEKGKYGIEIQLSNCPLVDEDGGVNPSKDPFEADSEAEAKKHEYYKKYVDKYGKDKVKVIRF